MIRSRTLAISALLCATALPAVAGTGTLTTLYTFTGGADGYGPYSGVIEHGGTLYGTTEEGYGNCGQDGTGPCGSVYAINESTGAETTLYTFTGGTDGTFAVAPLLFANNLLYGTAKSGGNTGCLSRGCGIVFSVDPSSGAETILYRFTGGADGANPESSLIYYNGLLYGAASAGAGTGCGSAGCGTIYSLDPTTGTETTLYTFTGGADGSSPYGALAFNGTTLFGVTEATGSVPIGTVFSFSITTNALTTLHSFAGGSDGAGPSGGVTYHAGLLYGATSTGGEGCGSNGCGTVYSLDTTSGTETVLYRFPGAKNGQNPRGPVILENGSLYGTTLYGGVKKCNGKYGCGTIYTIKLATAKAKLLHDFAGGADGVQPVAGLAFTGGSFYGTTLLGGTLPRGTVFKYTP